MGCPSLRTTPSTGSDSRLELEAADWGSGEIGLNPIGRSMLRDSPLAGVMP
jgi:hypothetical protein